MKQNIYDDPTFFEAYRKLRESESGLNGAVEEPAFLGVLADLCGKSVLDLGSGFGDFCRFACAHGASRVRGVEISRKMVEAARGRTRDPRIEYVNCAMEDFAVEPGSYDLVVSRMAVHYVQNYPAVLRAVHAGIGEGGSFVFSVEHPICTALCSGWYENQQGEPVLWPVDNYSAEGERRQKWFVDGVIKYHRIVETYVNGLLDCGFAVTRLLEPHAAPESLERRPDLQGTLRRPAVLIIAAMRPPAVAPMPASLPRAAKVGC
jgi:SAM-dependent methyltransferase